MRRLIATTLIGLLFLLPPVWAQEDEAGGLLVDFLEDTLSGDNLNIKVTGLEGALSSRATIKQLTISDADGIWLTINNAELDWNRLALLKRRFSVNTLSAEEIIIARAPIPAEPDPTLPIPEAHPFQLPELPVAIDLGKIEVKRFEMAKPVLGIAAALEISGDLVLADGALDTDLAILRLDRPTDKVTLVAKYSNETNIIALDLDVTEDKGGLIASALKIPGAPPLRLIAKGEGPVADFTADIDLSTSGVSRLTGQVRLQEVPAPGAEAETGSSLSFSADLSGNVTPLLTADYQPFFGDLTQLDLVGQRDANGLFEISRFHVSSDALTLDGSLKMAADGGVEKLEVTGRIAPAEGNRVLLPLTGARTEISGANVRALLDATQSNKWRLELGLEGLSRPELSLSRVKIAASGTLDQTGEAWVQGVIEATLEGMEFDDPNLETAVGPRVSLDGEFTLNRDDALELAQFSLQGSDYSAFLDGRVSGLESGFYMEIDARVGAADISRFSGLAGRPIAGAINATLDGDGAPLGGQFAFRLNVTGQDLSSGIAQLDPLITGQTTLLLDAARDASGLTINDFQLQGTELNATARGTHSSAGSKLEFKAALDDVARVLPEVSGPLNLTGRVTRDASDVLAGTLRLDGPQSSFVDLDGTLDPRGPANITYAAKLDRIERFVPEMTGSLSSKGTMERDGSLWSINGDANASAGFKAQIGGTWDEASGQSRLNANGEVQLAAANRFLKPNSIVGRANFDIALNGKAELAGLTGTISTSDAQFVLPALAQSIKNIKTSVKLANGTATLSGGAELASGGTFRFGGPIKLTPPFQGKITTDLQQLVLTDNISYRSVASGQLVYAGPMTGNAVLSGQIVFGETEINLNTASGSASAPAIPTIRHVGESGAERATRARAGLIETKGGSDGPVIGLDIKLSAPNRVFARGRGIQAELGGEIHVRGTSAQVVPAGQIELIRGNMNLLGRNLKLTRGLVSIQGSLEPYVEFAATTTTSEGSATMKISGPLSAPEVNVFSEPERPSEEALAMLVFGNQFADLSPLALAQMAASLAALSGRGGGLSQAREGLGVDDLGVGVDDGGAGRVGVGLYVVDNVYTNFTVNTDGDTEVNLNLDLTDNVTVKGTVDNKGATSMGIFFERDY